MVTVPFRLADIFSPDTRVSLFFSWSGYRVSVSLRSTRLYLARAISFKPCGRTTRTSETTVDHKTKERDSRWSFLDRTFTAVHSLSSSVRYARGTEREIVKKRLRRFQRKQRRRSLLEFVSIARFTHELSQKLVLGL